MCNPVGSACSQAASADCTNLVSAAQHRPSGGSRPSDWRGITLPVLQLLATDGGNQDVFWDVRPSSKQEEHAAKGEDLSFFHFFPEKVEND